MRIAAGLVLDAAFICLFAALGRRSHGETGALVGVVTTAWPFLAGMATGWVVCVLAIRRVPLRVRDALPVWVCAVAGGMVARALTHAGTAFSFIVVATLVLGALLLGWRALATLTARLRARTRPKLDDVADTTTPPSDKAPARPHQGRG